MASPHTRGWTPGAVFGRRPLRGFPAHAGMDRSELHLVRLSRGFPAHAGMDRVLAVGDRPLLGLPRTRGDGPSRVIVVGDYGMASPHTRGWTLNQLRGGLAAPGFPAHAGMDRARLRAGRCSRRLPRTRGDGPCGHCAASTACRASPHTRGWTRGIDGRAVLRGGFPAHAGMDPERPDSRLPPVRLPRTRGDGPWDPDAGRWLTWASPHTRGWTPADRHRPGGAGGFPAHAGMDRAKVPRR